MDMGQRFRLVARWRSSRPRPLPKLPVARYGCPD
jgi:hypothetical protein